MNLGPSPYLQDINEHLIKLKGKLNERIPNIILSTMYSVMMPLNFKEIETTWQEFQLLEEYIVKFFTKSYFPKRFTVTSKCSKTLSAWEEQYLLFLAIYIFSFVLPTRLVHRLSSREKSVFSCEYCEIFKSRCFIKHLQWLLLRI